MYFSFRWWPEQHGSLAMVRLYPILIGVELVGSSKRSVLANLILWYNNYLGRFGPESLAILGVYLG